MAGLSDAEHRRRPRRVEVETDDAGRLRLKVGFGRGVGFGPFIAASSSKNLGCSAKGSSQWSVPHTHLDISGLSEGSLDMRQG